MIFLTEKDREKLSALDKFVKSLPTEYIKEISEGDQIVDKLKGDISTNGFIEQLVNEHISMATTIMQLQSDIITLRAYLQSLVRIQTRPQYDYQNTNDLNTLKSSLGIY